MTQNPRTNLPFEILTLPTPGSRPRASWRRQLSLAALALFAALLAFASRNAQAAPDKAQFTQLIQDHIAECTWVLEDKAISGKVLAAKNFQVTITSVKWDDDHVYFHLTITPANTTQSPIINGAKEWNYESVWSYGPDGAAESPAWKIAEKPGVFVPRRSVTPSAMDKLRNIQRLMR